MWGVGATLFHALAGYRPFERGVGGSDATPEERWPQLVDEPHLLPDTVCDEVAKPVLACLEANPEARPTPSELAEAFEPAMAALPKARLSGFKVSIR